MDEIILWKERLETCLSVPIGNQYKCTQTIVLKYTNEISELCFFEKS